MASNVPATTDNRRPRPPPSNRPCRPSPNHLSSHPARRGPPEHHDRAVPTCAWRAHRRVRCACAVDADGHHRRRPLKGLATGDPTRYDARQPSLTASARRGDLDAPTRRPAPPAPAPPTRGRSRGPAAPHGRLHERGGGGGGGGDGDYTLYVLLVNRDPATPTLSYSGGAPLASSPDEETAESCTAIIVEYPWSFRSSSWSTTYRSSSPTSSSSACPRTADGHDRDHGRPRGRHRGPGHGTRRAGAAGGCRPRLSKPAALGDLP